MDLEQKALEKYYQYKQSKIQGYMMPVGENGNLVSEFDNIEYGRLSLLAQEEIQNKGYLIGVTPEGQLSEDTINLIEETAQIILEEMCMSEEERKMNRQSRVYNNKETFEYYNSRLNELAEDYKKYTEICTEYGIEAKPLYQSKSSGRSR